MFALRITIALFIVLVAVPIAPGQETPPPAKTDNGDADITASAQTVQVETTAPDVNIARRLQGIYEATDRFIDPQVTVEDGVVFLTGQTRMEGHREWAGNLARNTEGVVAVVNNIEVLEESLWSLAPARQEVRKLWRQIIQALPLVFIGIVVLVLTILIARVMLAIVNRQLDHRIESALVRNVLEKVLWVAVILIGLYIFLRITGLTRLAVTIAGGTGLLGLIVGFAFRDIAENFLASILISMQRPFRIGDTIEVADSTGVVQKVTTRGTLIMAFDGNHIQVPNSTIYKSTIRNFTANPKIRLDFVVGIGYDSSVTETQKLALDVLREHSAVLNDPAPLALVEELGAATINLRIYFWINGHEFSMLKVRSAVMRLTFRAFDKAGISLPDEAREVIFPHPIPIQMLRDVDSTTIARPKPTPTSSDDDHEASEAEGNLKSEVADIQQQADESRSPDEGEDILAPDEKEPTGGTRG